MYYLIGATIVADTLWDWYKIHVMNVCRAYSPRRVRWSYDLVVRSVLRRRGPFPGGVSEQVVRSLATVVYGKETRWNVYMETRKIEFGLGKHMHWKSDSGENTVSPW